MKRARAWRLGRGWWGIIVGLTCGLVSWAIAQQTAFQGLDDWFQDGCFALRGARDSSAKVVIVGIDDPTLASLPKPLTAISPELGEVVSFLSQRKAGAIGLDLMIPETLDDYDITHGLDGKALGFAAGRAGNVVLPIMVGDKGTAIRPLLTWRTGAMLSLVEVTPDADHIVRRQQLSGDLGGEKYDQLALALLQTAGLAEVDHRGVLHIDFQAVPLDRAGRVRRRSRSSRFRPCSRPPRQMARCRPTAADAKWTSKALS